MKKVLLFGATGQLGTELLKDLPRSGFEVVGLERSKVDLRNTAEIRQAIQHFKPAIVVNAAAYTAVDKAEEEASVAHAINAVAPAVMSQECERSGAYMVHYSTDYVFDGNKRVPYCEEDAARPLNVYGQSKLQGESEVLNSGARCVIFRIPWLYSCRGKNFVLTIIRLARNSNSLNVVDDQVGTPTPATLVSEVTAKTIVSQRLGGLFHLAPEDSVSRFDLAREIVRLARIFGVTVHPVSSSQYPSAVRRPSYSVLSAKKLSSAAGLSLLSWRKYLEQSISQFLATGLIS